jgi:hypothetical protein
MNRRCRKRSGRWPASDGASASVASVAGASPPAAKRSSRSSSFVSGLSSIRNFPSAGSSELHAEVVARVGPTLLRVVAWASIDRRLGPTEITVCSTMRSALAGAIAPPIGRLMSSTKVYVWSAFGHTASVQHSKFPVGGKFCASFHS